MRVLMHLRPDWQTLPGGDIVQVQRWTAWLRRLGVDVRVSDHPEPDLTGIDILHLHNLSRAYALWPTLQHSLGCGVRRVLTPLYWPAEEYERLGRPGIAGRISRLLPSSLRERLKSSARYVLHPGRRNALLREVVTGSTHLARDFLRCCDALLVNSHAEATELCRSFGILPPTRRIPSGVDAFYWSDDRSLWWLEHEPLLRNCPPRIRDLETPIGSKAGRCEGILCVARFDPQKGQHRLIEAARPLGVPLTLIGADNPHYPRYRDYCLSLGGSNVTVLPRQPLSQLREHYRGCQVFALPSWYEVSSLAGLEAACSGARVVISGRGGWREYGGDLAWYVDPSDVSSIRRGIEAALQAPATPDLRTRVVSQFTWEQGARALIQAYEAVLSAGLRCDAA